MVYTSFVYSVAHVWLQLVDTWSTTTTCNWFNHKVACYSQLGHHSFILSHQPGKTAVQFNPAQCVISRSLPCHWCHRSAVTSVFIMITPAFDLSQDPEYLILNIRVPYTRTSEFDLYIDGTDFKFYAKPYFLRWVNQCTLTYATVETELGWCLTMALVWYCINSKFKLFFVCYFQIISPWKNSGGWERKGQIWHR